MIKGLTTTTTTTYYLLVATTTTSRGLLGSEWPWVTNNHLFCKVWDPVLFWDVIGYSPFKYCGCAQIGHGKYRIMTTCVRSCRCETRVSPFQTIGPSVFRTGETRYIITVHKLTVTCTAEGKMSPFWILETSCYVKINLSRHTQVDYGKY